MVKVVELQVWFLEIFFQFGQVKIVVMWVGMIDVMLDMVLIIDEVVDLFGLVLVMGFSGYGFGIGLGVGCVVLWIVQGIEIGFNFKCFCFDWFVDGSLIILGFSLQFVCGVGVVLVELG